MALVKRNDAHQIATTQTRELKRTQYKLPPSEETPVINYGKLKELCLKDGEKELDHEHFMKNYHQIFGTKAKKRTLAPLVRKNMSKETIASDDKSMDVTVGKTTTTESEVMSVDEAIDSHDVRDHINALRKKRKDVSSAVKRLERIKTLRRIAKKLPYERTAKDLEQMHQCLKTIPEIAGQVPGDVLRELCVGIVLDSWKDPGMTVFGNLGFHVILKGHVEPLTMPYVMFLGDEAEFPCPTPEPEISLGQLGPGDCFGTLTKIEGREPNTTVLSVVTLEPCEFLRISGHEYNKVVNQIKNRDATEKKNLLRSCQTFNGWPDQPLIKVCELLEWTNFPANTVLVSEGFQSPFIAVIKTGECHVLRTVDALHRLPNGVRERRSKQVVMGKLGVSGTFGEQSVILQEPMTCSIVTGSPVTLATVDLEKVKELDETTIQLLIQSSEKTFGKLTQDDIHREYIEQEMKREWNEFKHGVVVDVINSRGIRPGYGKWTK